jgi:peptidoglycan hydrolase-like protein with peptidoglycan-binding domain
MKPMNKVLGIAGRVFGCLGLSAAVLAAQVGRPVTVPAGTVVPLRMETLLSSESSRVGDNFQATVFRDVEIDGRVAIPAGSKVEGRVTSVSRADRKSKAGTIAVAFDRLFIGQSRPIPLDATLTTLDEEARTKLESDEEGRVEGSSQKRRAVIFIGGGAGVGAVIGAITGGGKGAAVGAGIGAVLGAVGTLLSKGEDAEVKPGAEFGMMVERAFAVRAEESPQSSEQSLTSIDTVREAQMILRDRGFYEGPVDGRSSMATREALRRFQREQNLAVTGDLNLITARELGIVTRTGARAVLLSIGAPRAEAAGRDSIRIQVEAYTQGRGWQVFADHFTAAETLHVYVRGVRPDRAGPGTRDRHLIDETFNDLSAVARVVFHGAERDVVVDLADRPGGGSTGDARRIALIANRLVANYQRDLNIRGVRNQLLFDSRRDFAQGEIDLLSQFFTLASAADLYSQLVGRVRDQDALKDAADALLRQARFVNRLVRRHSELRLSSAVRNEWDGLRSELSRITITSNDLDTDIDRIR